LLKIKELLNEIIRMLRDSFKNSQADWLEEQVQTISNNNDEISVKAIKKIESIIAGIGSLSDIYLEVSNNILINEENYNAIYRNLVKELDSEISLYLEKN
jgi:hypothetical protein